MSEDAQVVVRKAVKQHETTYVALPINFVRDNGIEVGDKLALFVGKKSITLRKLEAPE